jgi:hypothetical protein
LWYKGRELKSITVKTKNENKGKILFPGTSHDKKTGPMLQENLGTKFDVCTISKQNDPLAKVVEDVGKH